MANNNCKECGCSCKKCTAHDVHLHVEIENLKQKLLEREHHINTMETTFLNEANKYPNGEFFALKEELLTWQDKYERLYEGHKRVQKVNQSLEDKLLKLVDKTESEKGALTRDVATLSHRLADANYTIHRLQEDNEKLKNEINLAIQLLQCKPANFVSQRIDSLPNEVQAKVSSYVASRRKPQEVEKKLQTVEVRSIKVPIPTFPPTAMVYSIPKEKDNAINQQTQQETEPQIDMVSAAIMAKILEERERERSFTKHCDTCSCSKTITPTIVTNVNQHSVSTQTINPYGKGHSSLCLKCNQDINKSPLLSGGGMKLVRSADSLIVVPNEINNINTYPLDLIDKDKKIVVSENSKVFLTSLSDTYSKKPSFDTKSGHHRLCDQNIPRQDQQKGDVLKKGPRFCSIVQSGSKNILLDNIDSSYTPVVYTRQTSEKNKHSSKKDDKTIIYSSSQNSGSLSSEDKKTSPNSEDNSLKHQRVAEWVDNIDSENNSENSPRDLPKTNTKVDMEIKNFNQKYLKTNSHTETDI